MYLIHEGSYQKDAATGAAEDVFWREGVGQGVRVEPRALIGDSDYKVVGGRLKCGRDVLVGVVRVAVKDGVDGCLTDGHGDMGDGVLIEACARGVLFCGLLNLVDAVERRIKSEAHAACR